MNTASLARVALLALAVSAFALAPAAYAGKGGKPGGGGGTGTTGSFTLKLLDSTDGVPHWGQRVTFDVSPGLTRPYVGLTCVKSGITVYSASAGFFPDYPWSKEFRLASYYWSSGAADCRAELYTYSSNGRKSVLSSLTFHVYA